MAQNCDRLKTYDNTVSKILMNSVGNKWGKPPQCCKPKDVVPVEVSCRLAKNLWEDHGNERNIEGLGWLYISLANWETMRNAQGR